MAKIKLKIWYNLIFLKYLPRFTITQERKNVESSLRCQNICISKVKHFLDFSDLPVRKRRSSEKIELSNGSYRMVIVNELKFLSKVCINKLHLKAKFQISSLNSRLIKKNCIINTILRKSKLVLKKFSLIQLILHTIYKVIMNVSVWQHTDFGFL